MTTWEWVMVALRAMAVVALGVRTAIEARSGRRTAWVSGLVAAVFLVLLVSDLHGAWRG